MKLNRPAVWDFLHGRAFYIAQVGKQWYHKKYDKT